MQAWSEHNVRLERTDWRCQELSKRHREWGFNCPGVDLDFVMAEYNRGKPVAIIEYKHKKAREPQLSHPTYRALEDLANNYNGGPLPFMVVFYCPDTWVMRVIPVNKTAQDFYQGWVHLSEQQFVRSLYKMRKITLQGRDAEAINRLNNILPQNQKSPLEATNQSQRAIAT